MTWKRCETVVALFDTSGKFSYRFTIW